MDLPQPLRMSIGRVSGRSKPRGEPILEDEDDDEDDYENLQRTPRPIAVAYLAVGYAPRYPAR